MVHIAHPLYGEVLRAQVPVLRARRRQRQLAEAVEQVGARRADDSLRVATWRLASGTIAAPEVLVAAANRAWRLLDLPLAERCARAAFDAGGQRQASEILWRVLVLQNRNDQVEQLLASVDDPTAGDQRRAQLVVARAYNLFWGLDRVEAGLALVDQAVAGMRDPVARAEVQSLQAAMLVNAGHHRRAADLADRLLEPPTLRGPVLATAHYSKGLAQVFAGQTGAAITSLNRAAALPDWAAETPWAPVLAALWRGQAQLLEGRLDAAATTAETAYQAALATGWDAAIGGACLGRGQVCRARGQLGKSVHWLREGLAVAREDHSSGYLFAFILLGELAHTTALLGDHTAAQTALAEADATKRASSRIYHVWLDLARPWVAAAGGDMASAIGQALEAAAAAASVGATIYQATALHDAARLGGVGKVADALHLLARTSSNVLVRSYAAHATALRAHDGATLDQVSGEFETIGMYLHAAEAVAEASRAHRQAGRADSARRAAAHAGALAARCDGPATPALAALRAPILTPREWEIVKLAAAGLTNEQIANRLVVSIRTVHNHLHQAYAKLGVHRRAELGAVVQPPNPHT
jgi:ATP/maltotriose-dependent transcriptional regulator MalT